MPFLCVVFCVTFLFFTLAGEAHNSNWPSTTASAGGSSHVTHHATFTVGVNPTTTTTTTAYTTGILPHAPPPTRVTSAHPSAMRGACGLHGPHRTVATAGRRPANVTAMASGMMACNNNGEHNSRLQTPQQAQAHNSYNSNSSNQPATISGALNSVPYLSPMPLPTMLMLAAKASTPHPTMAQHFSHHAQQFNFPLVRSCAHAFSSLLARLFFLK